MNVTKKELIAAFALWDREYREEPERFMSEVHRLLRETPDSYGDQAAVCLVQYVKRIRKAGDATDEDNAS